MKRVSLVETRLATLQTLAFGDVFYLVIPQQVTVKHFFSDFRGSINLLERRTYFDFSSDHFRNGQMENRMSHPITW
jgi:hypothetical protein